MTRVSASLLSTADDVARPQTAPRGDVLSNALPTSALPHATTNGRITIDPDAIVRNWHRLKRLAARECGAVVKADAYGCGLDVVGPALARSGCDTFFVATAREGLKLRALLPEVTIYVLNGIFEDIPVAVEARLIPFISSRDALEDWPQAAPFALNVDTGMNRLGLTVEEAIAIALVVKPTLVASHFGCADTPDHPLNTSQEERFTTVREAYRGVPASFANSAALLTRPRAHYDLARPGIALYGGVSANTVAPLEPAVRLEARVIQVRDVRAGETVGYGGAETLTRDARIAIVGAGYADGYLRAKGGRDGSPGAPVSVGGRITRVIGRVSMDLVAIDVTDVPCARGDYVELFGPNVPVDLVAENAGTIGYEVLTSLSRRADRHYAPL